MNTHTQRQILRPKSMYFFCEEKVHTFECVAKEYARSGTYFDYIMQRERLVRTPQLLTFHSFFMSNKILFTIPILFSHRFFFTIHFTMCSSTKLRSEEAGRRRRRTKRRSFVRRLVLTFMCNVCNEIKYNFNLLLNL